MYVILRTTSLECISGLLDRRGGVIERKVLRAVCLGTRAKVLRGCNRVEERVDRPDLSFQPRESVVEVLLFGYRP